MTQPDRVIVENGVEYEVPNPDVFVDGDDIDSTTVHDPGAPE